MYAAVNCRSQSSAGDFTDPWNMDLDAEALARRQSLVERIECQIGKPDLDLSLCNISHVPLDAIELHYGEPQSLDLSYNYIRFLPPEFGQMTYLKKLDLSRNDLRRLPNNFGLLENLVYLDVHKNHLRSLPLSMGKMTQLQYLNINENDFRPPISNILEVGRTRELGGVDTAHLVIQFLSHLAKETFAAGDIKVEFDTFDMAEAVNSFRNEIENTDAPSSGSKRRRVGRDSAELQRRGPHRKPLVPRRQPGETSLSVSQEKGATLFEMRLLGALMAVACICLFPLIFALFVETSVLDQQMVHHRRWKHAWKVYKPYHVLASNTLEFLKLHNRPFYVRGPADLGMDADGGGNFAQMVYRKVLYAVEYMLSYVWGHGGWESV